MRNMKKDKRKIFIIICAAVILIAAVVLVISLTGAEKTVEIKGDDLPARAFYRKNGNSIEITLMNPADSNYGWFCENERPDQVKITADSKSDRTVFNASSESEFFVTEVKFYLRNREDAKDSSYRILIGFEGGSKGELTVKNVFTEKLDGPVAGEIAGHKYSFVRDEKGEIILFIEQDAESGIDWNIQKNDAFITAIGPDEDENGVEFIFSLKSLSEDSDIQNDRTDIIIYSEKLLSKFEISLSFDENLELHILSHTVGSYEIGTTEDEEAKNAVTGKFGEIKIPAKAEKIIYETGKQYSSKDDSEGFEIADIEFRVDGVKWSFMFADDTHKESSFTWVFEGNESLVRSEKTVNGVKVSFLHEEGETTLAVWTAGGRVYALCAEKVSTDTAENLVRELI